MEKVLNRTRVLPDYTPEELKRITVEEDDKWAKHRTPEGVYDLTPAMTPGEIESALTGTPYPDPAWPASGTATTWTPSTMGRKGGSRKSPAKTRSSRENGKKGGRPRKVDK
jgi:hypothetical protein